MPDLRGRSVSASLGAPSGGPVRRRHHLTRRDDDGVLRQRRALTEQFVCAEVGHTRNEAPHRHAKQTHRPHRPRRLGGGAFQVVRWSRDSKRSLQAASSHGNREGARARVGARWSPAQTTRSYRAAFRTWRTTATWCSASTAAAAPATARRSSWPTTRSTARNLSWIASRRRNTLPACHTWTLNVSASSAAAMAGTWCSPH